MQQSTTSSFDVIIGGGGPTGLTMALALAHVFSGDVCIAVVDPAGAERTADSSDPRAWALSAASIRLLDRLGVWPAVRSRTQPVTEIEITDSALHAGVRPVLLSYDNVTKDGEPAAHIVPNQVLVAALLDAVQASRSIQLISGRAIDTLETERLAADVTLDDCRRLTADVIIAADGRASRLREAANIKIIEWRYDQTAIVVTVGHERPHGGKAVQHFLPGGPFAMLPLPGNRMCITWSEETGVARKILSLSDGAFLGEVQRRFGGKLGLVSLESARASFPLGMHLARSYVAPRFALVGDAAHAVHPIAGQGLNLALRDIAALAECISDGGLAGLPLGDFTILERYQSWRRFDSTLSASAFDAINRLFSNKIALLRSAREVGLGLVDRAPDLKHFFIQEAAGLTGEVPRLMQT